MTRAGDLRPIAAALGMGLRGEEAPVLVDCCPTCSTPLPRLAPRSCAACPACLDRIEEAAVKRRNIEAVPGRHRWARLEAPLVPPGQQRPVVLEASRIRAREWLEGRGQLLLVAGDDTGAGKTTLAAALACAAIEAGRHVVWIHASDLDPSRVGAAKADERRERLERAPFAVLDGLGKELVGAGAGVADGVATQRRGVVSAFVEGLQAREGNGQRVVITADMSRERMFAIYDDGMVRRLTVRGPHCEVIGLRRQAPIESERF